MGKKKDVKNIDGFSIKDAKRIQTMMRKAWSWSYPRRLCVERAIGADGFARCEKCKKKVPKVYPDHIEPVGSFGETMEQTLKAISRMFIPSKELQAICKRCHQDKTNAENKLRREREMEKALGF